jgi:hypothetical protein
MRLWGKRHATALAVVFALVLFVVVLAQAVMLYTEGWAVALGTLPEWVTAVGVVAAFLTLRVATKERQSLETERQAPVGDSLDHDGPIVESP